jgi:enoyl-CoA hydratase/carnithine racemase
LNAHDAREAGLVAHVVEADELEREALAFARRIAARSAAALRLAKRTMRGHERTEREFARACYLYTGALMQTQDALEGLNAFMEKRQPVWSHR